MRRKGGGGGGARLVSWYAYLYENICLVLLTLFITPRRGGCCERYHEGETI